MFITATFFGRAWCGWLCPMAGLSEICLTINNKPVPVKTLKGLRYTVFFIWFSVLITGFIGAGGIKALNPLYLTDNGISVDAPMKYVIYYGVLFGFFLLTIGLGKRGACHAICWMSPFLVAGAKVGKILGLPQLKIGAQAPLCVDCKKCDLACPMSISVSHEMKGGSIQSSDCILCGDRVATCSKGALSYHIKKKG